ncbi:Methyl-accepting chemotaxis protein (MCP) signaling domain protein [compost metagenome]
MSLKVKFNYLLTGAMVIALSGYLLQTTLSSHSMLSVNDNYRQIIQMNTFVREVDQVEKQLLALEQRLTQLNQDNLDEFTAMLEENKQAVLGVRNADMNDNPILQDFLTRAESYNSLLKQRLELIRQIGFAGQFGLLEDLAQVEKEINATADLDYSFLKSARLALLDAQNDFLNAPSREKIDALHASWDDFKEKLEKLTMWTLGSGELLTRYKSAFDSLSLAYLENLELQKKSQGEYRQLTTVLAELSASIEARAGELERNADQYASETISTLMILTILIASVAGTSLSLVIRHIVNSLHRSQQALSLLEQGVLTHRQTFSEKRNDAIDRLASSMNQMASKWLDVVNNVQRTSEDLNGVVGTINEQVNKASLANNDIMARTNSLAAATEEISVTMKGISSNTQEVNDSSAEAASETRQGAEAVTEMAGKVTQTMENMDRIKVSVEELASRSQEINLVIDVINDLANQTNLLALNAAIEAARAGDAGRGFSVVADEVRSLAKSTVGATAKITDTIRTFQQESRKVCGIVEHGGEVLQVMFQSSEAALAGIRSIECIVNRNSLATQEISHAIGEITNTIDVMSKDSETIAGMLQENAGAVEHLVSMGQMVESKSRHLNRLTSQFKTS